MQDLRELELRRTAVTNAGVMKLVVLPKVEFQHHWFRGTKVTKAGADAAFNARRDAKKKNNHKDAPKSAVKPVKKPEQDDALEAAKKLVRGFVAAMNKWEHSSAREANAKKRLAAMNAVFGDYCTVKERKHGRFGSFGMPPEYDPKTEQIREVTATTTSRIEVLTDRKVLGMDRRRIYVVVKKKDGWRIDSAKQSSGGKFSPSIL